MAKKLFNVRFRYVAMLIAGIILGIAAGYIIGRAISGSNEKPIYPMPDDVVLESKVFTYDTLEHSIEVEGTIPDRISIKYDNNNQKEVGSYTVTATFVCKSFKYRAPESISAVMTILPGELSLAYTEETYTYTGEEIKHVIKNLDPRFTATYYNNTHILPGEYDTYVIIHDTNGAYSDLFIPSKMTIVKPNDYGLTFEDATITYDGLEHSLEVTGDASPYSVVYKKNTGTNAGTYEAEAIITDPNGIKEPVTLTATLTIEQADMAATFDDTVILYDGAEHSIAVEGAPEGAIITYSANRLKEVGIYTITATITDPNGNYKDKVLTATLNISDELVVKMDDAVALTDKKEHITKVEGTLPEGVKVTYYNADNDTEITGITGSTANIGVHNIKAEVVDELGRYKPVTLTAVLEIKRGYNIVFRYAGATVYSYYIEAGAKVTDYPELPQEVGYEFKWEKENGDENNVKTDILFQAQSTATRYEIVYHSDILNPENPSTYAVTSSEIELLPLEKEGYVFVGWYSDEEHTNIVESIKTGTIGVVHLYPAFMPKSYEISYYVNNALYRKVSVSYDNPVRLIRATSGDFESVKWENSTLGVLYDSQSLIDKYQFTDNIRLDAIMVDKNYGFEVVESNGELTLTRFNGSGTSGDENIYIPSYYIYEGKYLPVVAIADNCFKDYNTKNNIEKVVIPKGIISIGKSAFERLEGLVQVELSSTVATIVQRAFFGCYNLEVINLSHVTYIGAMAFQGCDKLQEVDLSGLTRINDSSFESTGLGTVYISKSLTSIGTDAFEVPNTVKIYFMGTKVEFDAAGYTNLPTSFVLYCYSEGNYIKVLTVN